MSFSVGVLYSAQEFTAYVAENEIDIEEFKGAFKKFSLAKPEDILYVTTKCNWIDFHPDGICRITKQGKELLGQETPEQVLRLQICDLIHADEPPWAAKIPHGRQEAQKALPDEVTQCFKEAGLLKSWDDDVIQWWDRLAIATRSHKSSELLITGRAAERLTVEYETSRTGVQPRWQSIESNFSGYDVLSRVSKTDDTHRKIEVKGTTLSRKEAYFTVSYNEWRTAEKSEDYRFHLWCLKGIKPELFDVSTEDVEKHIPENRGDGKWETARIFFKCFC